MPLAQPFAQRGVRQDRRDPKLVSARQEEAGRLLERPQRALDLAFAAIPQGNLVDRGCAELPEDIGVISERFLRLLGRHRADHDSRIPAAGQLHDARQDPHVRFILVLRSADHQQLTGSDLRHGVQSEPGAAVPSHQRARPAEGSRSRRRGRCRERGQPLSCRNAPERRRVFSCSLAGSLLRASRRSERRTIPGPESAPWKSKIRRWRCTWAGDDSRR